ncbi:MAG TPA: alpha/beta hydrolase [Ktedonobacteraceae bacterium]|nr:alpha/beta hydrolase [Ktedonobacteraceae bacterium]
MPDNLETHVQSKMIDLPSGRFHYLNWGTEDAGRPAVVLLHGITSSAKSWVRVGPALADRYRVYALDMRGHGDSPKPPAGNYGLRQTADDAAAFIEALELDHPILIGHSWGGATAMMLASGVGSEKPVPNFAKIILEDPARTFDSDDPEKATVSHRKDAGRPLADVRRELIANNPGWSEEDIEGKLEAVNKMSPEAIISVFREVGQLGNLLPLLAQLPAPTLLLRADPDLGTTLPGATWDEARGYLPSHSQAVQIDGATHNMHRNKFAAFMQAVNAFLRS